MAIILDGTNGITTPEIVSSGGPLVVDSGAPDNSVVINSVGNLKAAATIAVGNATPSTSGAGITFPATASASSDANTLDDYEEGTFTPTVTGTSTAGTATYTQQVGRYTKIGNRVLINIYLQWTGGTGTGNLQISGLPFTSNSASLNTPMANYNGAVAMTASHVMQVITSTNSTKLDINSVPTGGGADANVAYDGAGLILIGGQYDVA